MRRAAYLALSAAAMAAAGALAFWGQARADDPVSDLRRVAAEVVRLPPGPGGYGRDCVWRTTQVLARIHGLTKTREIVTWGGGCHSVAGVWIGPDEWLVDGQSGIVAKVRGDWGGPFHMDQCDSARR